MIDGLKTTKNDLSYESLNLLELEGQKPQNDSPKSSILACFTEAARKVSPLWDVRDYVAVNPFFGFRDKAFLEAITYVKDASATIMLPSKKFFRKKYESNEITDYDLEGAISLCNQECHQSSSQSINKEQLLDFINDPKNNQPELRIRCLSDLYDIQHNSNITQLITNEVSKWASAYFDEGQAIWKKPNGDLRFYLWWKSLCQYDQSFGQFSTSLHSLIVSLPHDPIEAMEALISKVLNKAVLQPSEVTPYLYRLMVTNLGWSSYLKKFEFEAERSGKSWEQNPSGGLIDIVLIRLAYDVALLNEINDPSCLKETFYSQDYLDDSYYRYLWLTATEVAYRREIEHAITGHNQQREKEIQPLAQMVFCIDVRSETLRRHIEHQSEDLQTIGFAGFFGVPISVKGLSHQTADQQCPVLLNPTLEVSEVTKPSDKSLVRKKARFAQNRYLQRRIQSSANISFSFVETLGFTYIYRLIKTGLGLSKPNVDSNLMGLSTEESKHLHLDIARLSISSKVSLAYETLKNMGLTEGFAKYVFFVGHGSESSNNPYASALDCGACAGHNGHINAKFITALLNEREVRSQLIEKGMSIPAETVFLSGWHNTTTDQLTFDLDNRNDLHPQDIKKILEHLGVATDNCRKERSKMLSFCNEINNLEINLKQKANDWSEIRPEWGLARNASFIVAKRQLTRGLNLKGRSFLHDYDASKDADLSKLELIMTAPMIVTNWINMQYYASTIEPEKFGAGNKVLNNVVGTIACIQGNMSDLLGGLTEQSVRYKGEYYHEPIRLQVFIEADTSSIDKIISKHQLLRDLLDNHWLNLISVDPNTREFKLYRSQDWLNTKEASWN